MPKRLGPALELLLGRRLDRVSIAADDVAMVGELAARGTVVWVHRARNPVDHLALSRIVAREGFPRVAFVGGLNVLALQTLPMALSRLRRGPASARREERLLESAVRAGFSAEVFLRRPLHLLSASSALRARYVETLVRVQQSQERPIFLVPVFLGLRQRPGNFEPSAVDAILGSVEEPGLIRAAGRFIAAADTARLELSEPIDLQAFVAKHGGEPEVLAKKVRWSIVHHLARVERVAHGPPMKSHTRLRDDVLKDAKLKAVMHTLVKPQGELDEAAVEKRAKKLTDEIAARFDVDVTRFLDRVLRAIWARIYDAIIVDPADVERVRQAARKGPLVLVPSHRSHVDYLVMSQVMIQNGMLPPHIAAGENLSFFPLGMILRRGGAFFLRRSFKGDVLYGAVFRAYVRRLFKEGLTQEFFIEGGRSRTGKTLPPKLGLLSMLVDAWLESREDDAVFVPCHIAYEKIVEATSYTKELGGAPKEKESAAGLVKAAGVLRGRYGKVFVTFDEPISLKQHMAQRSLARGDIDDLDEDVVRSATAALGHRIVYGINRAGVVTGMSLVCASIFGFRRKGLDEELLLQGAQLLLAHLIRVGARRFEAGLTTGSGADTACANDADVVLRGALKKLVNDRLLVCKRADERVLYSVDEAAWLILDVHKNHLLHHAVPEAIVATAIVAAGGAPGATLSRSDIKKFARALSRILKLEFIFAPGVPFDALFDRAIDNAVGAAFVTVSDGNDVTVPDSDLNRAAFRFARNLIRGFVECYRVVLQRLPGVVGDGGVEERQVVARLLDAVRAGVLAGDVTSVEAASKATVENAVALAIELGFVRRDGRLLFAVTNVSSASVDDGGEVASGDVVGDATSREAMVSLLSRC
jgi:glycerol-3-phosphate O-acyltransferase